MKHRRLFIILVALFVVVAIVLVSIASLGMFVSRSNAWASSVTQIDKLQSLGFDGSGVTIGIVDTGVDVTHQEFERSSFVGWYDALNKKSDYYDDDDQGTHIAGILVAHGSPQGQLSDINLQGIVPAARFIIVKAVATGEYFYSEVNDSAVADGIQFCIDQGADIICLSLGRNPDDFHGDANSQTAQACERAVAQGIFVIAPAGNDGQVDDGDVAFPASLENVLAVGAIRKNNVIASFSSQGHQYINTKNPNKKPEIVAPGVTIVSTRTNGAYGEMSGTSQATAYVTGILALLLDAYPAYKHGGAKNQNETTIHFFKDIFAQTAKKINGLDVYRDPYDHDDRYGYGLIQAYAAYEKLAQY